MDKKIAAGQYMDVYVELLQRQMGRAAATREEYDARFKRDDERYARMLQVLSTALSRVMPHPLYIPVSVHTGEGLDRWIGWLERLVPAERRPLLMTGPPDSLRQS